MDNINGRYASLQSLDDLDADISRIGREKSLLARTLQSKSLGQSEPASESQNQVSVLVQEIKKLSSDISSTDLNNLIIENGDLKILTKLRSLTDSKQSLIDRCSLLEARVAVENQISQLAEHTDVQEFIECAEKIHRIDSGEPLEGLLQTQFASAIDRKRSHFTSSLSEHLVQIKWLSSKEKVTIDSKTFKKISQSLRDLVELQAIQNVPRYPDVWWGLETLLEPFVIRFNYHFRQASETNKLTKPEWALNYAEEFLDENLTSLEFVVGEIFTRHEKIGVFEIITAVLKPVREKLSGMLATINQKISKSLEDEQATDQFGRLLSHLIFEVTTFDQRLRNTYKYNPFMENLTKMPEKKWMGLTGDILLSDGGDNISVSNWLSLELRLSKKRFDTEIVSPKNAFDIDYEFTASSDFPQSIVKPTYSAFGMAKLFENLTSHFKTVNIVKFQLKYVSQIQLVFLDQYLEQLHKQFRRFNESLGSKLISSFMPTNAQSEPSSATQSIVTNGLTGLEMLTGIHCSIRFVIGKMEEWAEDLIYIQLWNYCQSSSGDTGESVFYDSINDYELLLSKVAKKYDDFFRKEARGAMKEWVNSSNWDIDDPNHRAEVSPSLTAFVTTFTAYASFLQRSLPEIDYYLVSSKICDSFAQILFEYIITNNQFSKQGLAQFRTDFDYLRGALKDQLMLDDLHKYSNLENKNLKKISQSIEMMERFDVSGARLLKKQFDHGDSVRSQFDSRLDCLSDSECLDLLFRII